MRSFLFALLFLLAPVAHAGQFTLHVVYKGTGDHVASLYRYDDLFTLRTVLIARSPLGDDGRAVLTGDIEGVNRTQLRIGDRSVDLFARPGTVLHVEVRPGRDASSLNGTAQLEILFMDIDRLDINALSSDVNERIDAFIAEDLATDQAAGMQAVNIQRKPGAQLPDSAKRPPTLFVTPVLSKQKLDTFEVKLRRFYAEVKDPWFAHYLDNSIAGLRIGTRSNERDFFEARVKGRPVLYDDPEYVRLTRNLFTNGLEQVQRYHADSLLLGAHNGDRLAARHLFQHNDFLRTDDRLAELVMIDQLYLNHASRLVPKAGTEALLRDVAEHSEFKEHRSIAANMLWDLTTMRVGNSIPPMRLEDEKGNSIDQDELLKGPVCIAFTAGWCTYCAAGVSGLIRLSQEYTDAVKVVIIGLDRSLEEFNALRKATGKNNFIWVHAMAEQDLREQLRIRSLPEYFLLNDGVLARSPAPPPEQGLGILFHQAKVAAEKKDRIKVWDE